MISAVNWASRNPKGNKMPHILLEYSAPNLTPHADALLRAAYDAVVASGLFQYESIKARHIAYDAFILPQGAQSFAHIAVKILDGRTLEQRSAVSDAVFAAVQATGIAIATLSIALHEMDGTTYRK
jgi:5-carboxymethyl-2-hydroxymuconate isomerase